MGFFFLLVFISFCFQFMALGYIKNRLLRWIPVAAIEMLLIFGMVQNWLNPPSSDILGWEIYLWLLGGVLLGGVLAWGAYALYIHNNTK